MICQRPHARQDTFDLMPAIFLESAQRCVCQKFLCARLFREWREPSFDVLLQARQRIVVPLESNLHHARPPFVREKADALGAQTERCGRYARFLQGLLYGLDRAGRDIAQKHQRQVKLFCLGPANVPQREWFRLLLDGHHFMPDCQGNRDCHEQPESCI